MGAMAFPCQLIAGLGRFRPLSETEEIAQSVRMILTTKQGERPCRPEFGTQLDQFAFENMDTTTCNLIRQEVVASLQKWEPRIWMIQVDFEKNLEIGVLYVNVRYQICASGVTGEERIDLHFT